MLLWRIQVGVNTTLGRKDISSDLRETVAAAYILEGLDIISKRLGVQSNYKKKDDLKVGNV